MTKLREISDHSVFTYPNEVTVELRGETADGEFATVTYQLEPENQEADRVQARGSIDSSHAEMIREALTELGYDLTEI